MSSNKEVNITKAESQEILEKYDRESAFRTFTDFRGVMISAILIIFSLFQLYSTWHVIPSTHMRPIHLAVVVPMAFILYPASKKMKKKDKLPWYDIVLALLSLAVYLYPVIAFDSMINQFGYTQAQIVIGAIGILLLLEACRRVVGLPIVIISICFVCIGLFGRNMPGFLRNRGFTVQQLVQHLYYTQEGVFGTPVGASATFIFLFILFGSFLDKTGVGAFFIDLCNAIAGNRRGGPAKVAILTSALEGTVSGSSVANTVGSGSFTIPMMKNLGYKPEFAAAVEAAASTGGQIMPPVMGAAAFLMAENLGLPFGEIIKAAIIPALLYFAGIYIVTDLEAKKLGLTGMEKSMLPKLKDVMLKRGFLILPILSIVVLLTIGYTASFAAMVGILVAILGSYIPTAVKLVRKLLGKNNNSVKNIVSNTSGLKLKDYFSALEGGARSIISVALACGVAGIIVGMITKTGIGLKMGAGLTSLANGNLILLLALTMLASIVLGMGVPTTPNYLITSTIMAPIIYKALLEFLPNVYAPLQTMGEGYALLPAHLFAFYFGIVADITPPVALAAMAGAAIAKADPLKTGINASKLAIAAFLIPYIFVMNPQLLMLNAAWYEVLQIMVTSLIGMLGVGMCLEKFWDSKLNIIQQVLALVGGLALIYPGTLTDIIGIVLVGGVIVWQRAFRRNDR
ncbi:MAG: TRAP transporter permease [Oscillospiraceae bacterium]|nr:TRAP transporter permease [Prevotella sp.]MBQ9167320.1 TRAP transporter permease [Oscillospiraceae bacterium]